MIPIADVRLQRAQHSDTTPTSPARPDLDVTSVCLPAKVADGLRSQLPGGLCVSALFFTFGQANFEAIGHAIERAPVNAHDGSGPGFTAAHYGQRMH